MKTPLHYQISEYDCGPTTLLNAMRFLFEREEIPPEVIRNIMLYSLDSFGTDGSSGKNGTSCMAMMFLCNWLNGVGRTGMLPVSGQYLSGSQVYIGNGSAVNEALDRNGVAVVRLFSEIPHYVLMTGTEEDSILLFDPYYEIMESAAPGIRLIPDQPFRHNRCVAFSRFNKETEDLYALGCVSDREAVLLFNDNTKLTAEKSIEYFI